MNDQVPSDELMARARNAATQCIKSGYGRPAHDVMEAEFQAIAREIVPWNLSGEEIVRLFLRPMQESLAERLPISEARWIYLTFFDILWNRPGSDSSHCPRSRARPFSSSTVPAWYNRHLAEIFRSGEPSTRSNRDPL